MLYIRSYKVVYLFIITVNLILQWRDDSWTIKDPLPYMINIGAIVINIITFALIEKGFAVSIFIEKALSVVRMLVLLIIATLIFAGPVFLLLPTAYVIWRPIIEHAPSLFYLWPFCAVFFTLEILFFRKLSTVSTFSGANPGQVLIP